MHLSARIIGLFTVLFVFQLTIGAQQLIRPSAEVQTGEFPLLKGSIWYRGHGTDSLKAPRLAVKEDEAEVEISLTKGKAGSAEGKKRVVFLIENHFKPRGREEVAFFSSVINSSLPGNVNKGDQFMVCTFDWYRDGKYFFSELNNYTDDAGSVSEAIRNIKPKSDLQHTQDGSDIYQALLECIRMVAKEKENMPTAIFLFSDDLDNSVDPVKPLDVRIEARKNNIALYGISFEAYSRYHSIIRDEICNATFGEYFCSADKDIKISADRCRSFLACVVRDNNGTNYDYVIHSAQKKKGQTVQLSFELKQSGEPAQLVSVTYPSRSITEWAKDEPIVAAIITTGALLLVGGTWFLMKRSSDNKKLQQEDMRRTAMEMERQKLQNALQMKQHEADLSVLRKKQEQDAAEREQERRNRERNAEVDRLRSVMLRKGAYPRLSYNFGGSNGSVEINSPQFSIGREKTNDFFIQLNTISRKHALISFSEQKGYILSDNGSSNGTFVNGEKINEQELHPGDHIRIGDVELIFQA